MENKKQIKELNSRLHYYRKGCSISWDSSKQYELTKEEIYLIECSVVARYKGIDKRSLIPISIRIHLDYLQFHIDNPEHDILICLTSNKKVFTV